uniref:hypothetical protein n=1 Tax=Serratia marcescens TaxID=615 RepID=UPI001F4C1635|nr:hypothetical protein [Serratia marcescens]ULG13117.1 hypothetical protein 1573p1_00057 [Serratia marcescens]
MLRQSEVRNEVAWILKSVKESDALIPGAAESIRPAKFFLFFYMSVGFVSLFTDFYNHLDKHQMMFVVSLGMVVTTVLMALIFYGYGVAYLNIPQEVRNKSKLIAIIKKKLRFYLMINPMVWVVISIIGLGNGGSGYLAMASIPVLILSLFALNVDMARYQISGFFGAINAAKKEFGSQGAESLFSNVDKERP